MAIFKWYLCGKHTKSHRGTREIAMVQTQKGVIRIPLEFYKANLLLYFCVGMAMLKFPA